MRWGEPQLAAWRSRPEGRGCARRCRRGRARQLVTASLERADGSGRWLDAAEADTLLRSFGIPTVEMRRVHDAAGAVSAATELGGPVVLKVGVADVVHKTEVEGVALNLDDDEAVRSAFDAMHARFGAEMDGGGGDGPSGLG